MNWASLKHEFDTNGFVVIRGFLPPNELKILKDNLDRYVREVVPTLPDGDAFYEDKSRPETLKQMNRIQQDPFFAEYLKHPIWTTAASNLLGESAWVHGAEWFNKPPRTQHPTPPHQDNYYFCLEPPLVLTMWLALDDVDEENGCLRYIEGSHLEGIRPHNRTKTLGFSQGVSDYGDLDRARETPIPAQPGDVLIHHGNTIHRADANQSPATAAVSGWCFRGVSAVRNEAAFQRYTDSSKSQHQELGLKT